MEEKLHNMIRQSKIDETKDHMRKVARKLDQEKLEKAKAERTGAGVSSYSAQSYHDTVGIGSGDFDAAKPSLKMSMSEKPTGGSTSQKKGLQLGKGRKNKDILESLRAEGETVETDVQISKVGAGSSSKPSRPPSEQAHHSNHECRLEQTACHCSGVNHYR